MDEVQSDFRARDCPARDGKRWEVALNFDSLLTNAAIAAGTR